MELRLEMRGDFVVGLCQSSIKRYYGTHWAVIIPRDIEILGNSCFRECETISIVRFKPGSTLSRIDDLTFSGCSSLFSMASRPLSKSLVWVVSRATRLFRKSHSKVGRNSRVLGMPRLRLVFLFPRFAFLDLLRV
jgi:hypothetical protein